MSTGISQFKCTYASYINDDDAAYYGETRIRQFGVTPQILTECLKRIPDENLYPKKPMDITIFSLPNTEGLHVKQTLRSWHEEWKDTDYLPRLLLGEIEAVEFLHRHPHPNIVKYYGCKVNRRDKIVGIVMDQYERTLKQHLDDKPGDINTDSCFAEIESAIKHLHSLGLAHNDLNPYNIMLDKYERPILIDFGSCKPFGKRIMEGGTSGWVEEGKVCIILALFLFVNIYTN